MDRFFGRYEHSLDGKGRVILPAKFRAPFAVGGYLTEHLDGCLALWTPEEFEIQGQQMQERAGTESPGPQPGPDVGVGLSGGGHRPAGSDGDTGPAAAVRRACRATSWSSGPTTGWSCGTRPGGRRSWDRRSSGSARVWTTDGRRRSARAESAASGTAPARERQIGRQRRGLAEDQARTTETRSPRHGDTRPMRSPSAGSVEDSSSARFQPSRRSNPPDGIPPVEGLRMRQVFDHEPVMASGGGGAVRAGSRRVSSSTPPSAAGATPAPSSTPTPTSACSGSTAIPTPWRRPASVWPGSATAPRCATPPSTAWPRRREQSAGRPTSRSPASCSTWA